MHQSRPLIVAVIHIIILIGFFLPIFVIINGCFQHNLQLQEVLGKEKIKHSIRRRKGELSIDKK